MKLVLALVLFVFLYTDVAFSVDSTFCAPHYVPIEKVEDLAAEDLGAFALSTKIGLTTQDPCEAKAIQWTINAKNGEYPWFDPAGERFLEMKKQ